MRSPVLEASSEQDPDVHEHDDPVAGRRPASRPRASAAAPFPMSEELLLGLLLGGLVLAFAFGIWAGLGYPGLYDKYEKTGKAPRRTPFEMLTDWLFDRFTR